MSQRKDLSLSEKNEILKQYDALPKCSQRQAAIKLGIPQSSLNRILHQRNSIYTDISLNCNVERKRRRCGKDFVFGEFLLQFCEEYIEKNGTVSRGVLIKKAEELAKEFGLKDFKATDGWLSRWKQRNNIALNKEKCNKYSTSAQNWTIENVPSILENYAPNKIFNADVAELYIHAYTNGTTKTKNNVCFDDQDEEKVTVLLTCNMVGNKKIPLVVGKSKYLDCFKGIKTLPVQYENSEDALMTRDIFLTYLLQWDIELGHEKIVLILDCSFSHFKDLSLQNIKMVFLPPDITTLIHPLDQGIMRTFKLLYRKNVQLKVNHAHSDGKGSVEEILKELTFLDIIHLIANAWLSVSASCIYNSFKKAGFYQKTNHLESIVNRLKESEVKEFYCIPNKVWPSTCESDTLGKTDLNVSEEVDMTATLEETGVNIKEETIVPTLLEESSGTTNFEEPEVNVSILSDDEVKNISGSSKDLEYEQNISSEMTIQDHITAKETRNALSVLRKTLEQKGASVECYELFYKMENEVCKLLQKT